MDKESQNYELYANLLEPYVFLESASKVLNLSVNTLKFQMQKGQKRLSKSNVETMNDLLHIQTDSDDIIRAIKVESKQLILGTNGNNN